jgi:hypothetical protein
MWVREWEFVFVSLGIVMITFASLIFWQATEVFGVEDGGYRMNRGLRKI